MINILIPLAGEGKTFKERYTFPKSLVEINGKPMIQRVVENLRLEEPHRFIFIIRKEDDVVYSLGNVLRLLSPDCKVIISDKPTAGAACSALLAIEMINGDEPLLVANADQILDTPLSPIIGDFTARKLDGGIITFNSVHPRWSFVRVNDEGLVVEAAEKRPISKHATIGFYYFKKGSDFVGAAMGMIKRDASVNGQFYVCPAYNEMVLQSKRIGIYGIRNEDFHSLGTPEDVFEYENLLKLRSKQQQER